MDTARPLQGADQASRNDEDTEQLEYSSHWDSRAGFPPTPPDKLVHWSKFNVNIYSDEMEPGDVVRDLADYNDEWIDLRPYVIEFPQKVSRFAKISKALEMFRTYHLRHLLVINPKDDSLAGIITRKDLDAFMSYDHDAEMRRF